MDLPTIPTDNLYKFMSIFGLVIIIVFFAVPKYFVYEAILEGFKVGQSIDVYRKESEYLKEQFNRLKKDIDNGKEFDNIKADELLNLLKSMDIKAAEQNANVKRLGYLESVGRYLEEISLYGLLAGCFLSISGFALWYFNVQRYEDRKMKQS